jgi:hypothetical protein
MGYLLNNIDSGITFGGKLRVPLGLDEYPPYFVESKGFFSIHDSSWGTKPRPQAGHVVMRKNGPLHWSSKALKVIVADSTCHAETAEASRCGKSTQFLRMGLEGIQRPVTGPTTMLGDNKAMNELVVKEGSSQKSRHFERATIFVKYLVMRLVVLCRLVKTTAMVADIFTKAADNDTFFRMRRELRNLPREDYGAAMARRATRIGTYIMNAMSR